MAKGAATEAALGSLHAKLAKVFTRVLERYEKNLDVLDDEMLGEELLAEMGKEPSPAMLSAIAKFLKDNEVQLDSGEIDELNSTARRLAERRAKRREAGLSLDDIPVVGSG